MNYFSTRIVMTCVALAAGGVGLATAGWAADEELFFAEIPTVYAAARHDQPVSQAPAAVTVITRDDIHQYGYRTLAQALASVPGFYVSDDRSYQSIGVRGLGIPTDYNIRVLVLLNGMPINDKYYGGAAVELTPDLFDAIERIEIVKGPGSALLGSNALFATVNLITRRGRDIHGGTVSAEGGWQPLGRGVVSYGNTFTNGLDLFLSGHYQAGTGESRLSFGQFGTAHNADEQRLSDAFLSVKYEDFFLQLWFGDQRKEIPTGAYGTIIGDDRTHVEHMMELAELRWQRAVTDKLTLLLRGYGAAMCSDGQYLYADPSAMFNGEHTRDTWTGYEVQVNWQPWDAHRFTVGAVYEYHWTSLAGDYRGSNGVVASVYPGFHDDFAYWALYVQDEIRLLTNLCLTVGGRYDAYPCFDMDRLTPRGALVWNPVPATTVKLLYGSAFRAPSQLERFYPAGSATGPANSTLGSERITTYELVLEQDFHRGLLGRVSVFHNDTSRLIAATVANQDQTVFQNLFNVRTTGIEAELSKKFSTGFRGFVNGTWQNSAQSSGALLNSPHWLANAGLVVPLHGDKLTLALRENYVGERAIRVTGRHTDPAWTTDLVLNSDNWVPQWSFNVGLYNLFDARPTVPSGADGTLDEIPQPGRAVIARATFHF